MLMNLYIDANSFSASLLVLLLIPSSVSECRLSTHPLTICTTNFFFSSRRRHTRYIGDWSSDVCSSDLGRYDIRYENEEDFKQGRNFQIVELNGASSEATSIYDPRNSLISAYRTLFRQWKLVFAIGAANRARGCRPSPLRTLWREWRQYSVAAVSYPCGS